MMASYAFFGFTVFHSFGGCSGRVAARRRPIMPGGKVSCVFIMISIVSFVDHTADPVLQWRGNRSRNIVLRVLYPAYSILWATRRKRVACQWYGQSRRW